MLQNPFKKLSFLVLLLAFVVSVNALSVNAQTENINDLKERAAVLVDKGNMVDALPILEKIAALEPNSAVNQFNLGSALLAKTRVAADKTEIKELFMRARTALIKAKELNHPEPKLTALINSIPDDGVVPNYTKNAEVEKLMQEGEAFFAQGKMSDAFNKYQKALELDPTQYYAALYAGDTFVQREDFSNAEIWYQKAIQINPLRETAYRYSATPLMKQKKYDQARERYIEAYITEPFNQYSVGGMQQWAQITGAKLGHPKIDIPTDFSSDGKGKTNITIDANTLLNGSKSDGSVAWMMYGVTRATWQEEFTKKFPNEKAYRHSLAEELDALQSVLRMATSDKKVKKLSPSLALLKELNDKGLLESYILLALTDKGIYQDYAEYLKQNRAKLRQYVSEYVVQK